MRNADEVFVAAPDIGMHPLGKLSERAIHLTSVEFAIRRQIERRSMFAFVWTLPLSSVSTLPSGEAGELPIYFLLSSTAEIRRFAA